MASAKCGHGESATREVADDIPNKTDLAMVSNITVSKQSPHGHGGRAFHPTWPIHSELIVNNL